MSDHTIAPGFTIANVRFANAFNNAAAVARKEDWGHHDELKWRLTVGRFDPSAGGQPAFATTCSFTPRGAPGNVAYAIKQIAFHKFLTAYYIGVPEENGSLTMATTSVNFTWNLDVTGRLTGKNFAAPSFPFFLDNPVAVANSATGSIRIIDSPGGTARLVRTNLVTNKMNFLRRYESATTFITMLMVVTADDRHIPVHGVAWNFMTRAALTWTDRKPTLAMAVGSCAFDSEIEPGSLPADRLRLFTDNALSPTDTILYKVNSGLIEAERQDAGALANSGERKGEATFNGGTFEIVHSDKLLL